MKKWYLLIAGAMLITATAAYADCGSCEGAEKAKGKAACEMKKGADKASCAMDKASCAEDKAACEMKSAKEKMKKNADKHEKMMEESKDNASEQAQKTRKKWWKFWGSNEDSE